ncbi:glycosyltransferase [Photobacterium carnosum]|uniref:glycosyltransferase n=1 Tax=Photobacterium carnosum TaxID=2023717 RepID=UPI001F41411A|nr:glycosyltransferase [Photobacterium carnosum]MCF2155743.1 glycosyltransferase [Photobacterium carnosum]MCF2217576.1 glycosyltransferase [Photobacterium carnosum]
MKICFLLWSPDISGGTNVIFEHATRLVDDNNITIVTHEKVCLSRLKWFPGAEKLTWKTFDEITDEKFDLAIATWWRTVYDLNKITAERYCYFVQSIESKFYPEEDIILRNLVELTYSLDLCLITEATWIKNYLKFKYNQDAYLIKNGIRKEYFNTDISPISPRNDKLRVLVEGPLGVSFKNTELAVELALQSNADEVWMLTSTEIAAYPKVDRLFSRVPISKVGEIYSSCDILIKLSTVEGMFGPPLECYHCGATSITYDVTGYDEYIVDNVNGLVSFSRDNQDIISKINSLEENRGDLSDLKVEAIKTANRWPDWDTSSSEFLSVCCMINKLDKKQNIQVISHVAMLSWRMYEEAIQLTNNPQAKNSVAIRSKTIVYRIAHFIHLRSPRLFSFLRKIKWTLKSLF